MMGLAEFLSVSIQEVIENDRLVSAVELKRGVTLFARFRAKDESPRAFFDDCRFKCLFYFRC